MWPFDPATGESAAVDRRTDPEAWSRWAEADVPITVQWDDGRHGGASPGGLYTSSASMPSLVFSMLRDLDARPGMSVLEVGTGTGWNAALLSARLGDGAVTTVEVDAGLAATAADNLHRAGFRPAVVAGDGLLGRPERAPFDRVIATCGLRSVPSAWISQTRPGGVVLVPWGTDYSPLDGIARLVVAEDGESASGRFTGPAQFMKARSQRLAWPDHEALVTDWPGEVSSTALTEREAFSDDPYGALDFAVGLKVPRCVHARGGQDDGARVAWFYAPEDRSWALVRFPSGAGRAQVHQSGPRRLWDEVEAAYRWWAGAGRPGIGRFGLTVGADGAHRVWLDDPDLRF
ncbi:methyltransferase domain-containing protein [Nocardiopsis potens]|uniref:methyltransferase domain-containing protein n=1 Tax=Nocardiopsis potens TaxID=1246458 RepID=UPI00035F3FD7|nr:methyltransferase domain-containing protein [Nocardiopsis potens]